MDAERQLIGSLLLDSSRIDDLRSVRAEMFRDSTLGKIFSIYANANGKEINQLVIVPQITASYRTEQQSMQLLAELVEQHDAGISDDFCEDMILQDYKSRKVNEIINYSLITPNSVDTFLADIRNLSEALVK